MLRRLCLTDFQRHRKLTVDFDDRVTTVVGRTEAGKSAVLRALRWLCLGGQAGGFTRHGSKGTRVTLFLDDNHRVTRKRYPKENTYEVDGGAPYEAVRTDVPQAVRDLLMLGEVNFQAQLDPPFLVCDPPGEVGRTLNRVVNMDAIDDALSKLDAGTRAARQAHRQAEEALADARARLDSLAWLDGAERRLRRMEALEAGAAADAGKAAALREQLARLTAAEEAHAREAEKKERLDAIVRVAKVYIRLRGEADAVRDCLTFIDRPPEQAPPMGRTEAIRRKLEQIQKAREEVTCLKAAIRSLGREEASTTRCLEESRAASEEAARLLEGACPLCGRT